MRTALLSIGDRVERGQLALHSPFHRACNFTRGGRLTCVVDEGIGAGPLNIVLAGFEAKAVRSLWVGTDSIVVGNRHLRFGECQRYDSALRVPHADPTRLRRNLRYLRKRLVQSAPVVSLAFLIDQNRMTQLAPGFAGTLAREAARCAGALFRGDLSAGITGLKGCGPGLTPSGDDLLAGVLVGLHVVQQLRDLDMGDLRDTIFAAATGDNLFSNNFLEMAHSGNVSEHVQGLITALIAGRAEEVTAAARKLLTVGSTSGADFATGLYMAICDDGEIATRCPPVLRPIAQKVGVGAWS